MTPSQFRKCLTRYAGVEERSHCGHPDFRLGGKIVASLGPDDDWAMIKLRPAQQAVAVQANPEVFTPCPGAWGKRGYTRVLLPDATIAEVRAWVKTAIENQRGE